MKSELGALWVLLTGCTLALLPVFSAFAPVDLGVSPREEPMPMVLHFAAALCALGLALHCTKYPNKTYQIVAHPIVIGATFIALWSALVAPFVDYPLLSLLGNTGFGEGAIRYLCIAVLFSAALVLNEHEWFARRLFFVIAVVSFVSPVCLYLWAREFFVSLDLVGQFAYSAAISTWLLLSKTKSSVRILFSICAATPALILSTNQTAAEVLILFAFPAALLSHILLRRSENAKAIRILAVFTVIAAPFLGLAIKWLLPEIATVPSIYSRHLLDKVLLAALEDDPFIGAIGQGWGAINLTMDRHVLEAGAVMWDGSWDLSSRNVSHSHSTFTEALFGAGIPAFLGLLFVLSAPIFIVSVEKLPLAVFSSLSLAGIGAITGEFPSTVGATALAFGLGAAHGPDSQSAIWPALGKVWTLAAPVFGALLAIGSAWQFSNADEIRTRVADVREKGVDSSTACQLHPNPGVYADMDLVRGLVRAYRPAFDLSKGGTKLSREAVNEVAGYLCSAQSRLEASRSPSLHVGMQAFRVDVALGAVAPELRDRFSGAVEGWPRKIVRLLDAAPERTDTLIGYFALLIQVGDNRTMASIAQALVRKNPADPVGHWFLGAAYLRAGNPEQRRLGAEHMQQALDLGITRLIPVSEDEKAQIRALEGYFKPSSGAR